MRRSLYLKDDDYRLSFLYGNFTTLTRFTEADLERVVTERLSPLHVSIHADRPRHVRNRMLRNDRGGMSLRWLRALLDHGIEVRGQSRRVSRASTTATCSTSTLAGVLDRFPELASVAVVPLGLSKFNPRVVRCASTRGPRPNAVVDTDRVRGSRGLHSTCSAVGLVYAADEYYLMSEREPFPPADDVRRLPDARGRDRHGPHVRARVRGPGRRRDRRAERLLRGRRPAGTDPGGVHGLAIPARSIPSTASPSASR